MRKRIVSMLLILAMLVTGFTVTASAAEQKTVNGATYTMVKNDTELAAALQAGENVMLANDIELTDANFPQGKTFDLRPAVIDGNGYTLTYSKLRNTALFNFLDGTEKLNGTHTVRNISFGTKDAPIVILGADGLFKYTTDLCSELIFENVNFYVERKSVNSNSGAIFAKLGTIAHFRGCTLDVEMTNVTGGTLHGGWFGEILANGQVELDDCTTTGNIKGRLGAAGFVAQNSAGDLEFNNCRNLANVTAADFVAGFVANMGTGCVSTYAADCINYGTITSTGTTYESCAGGIFGRVSNRKTIATWRLHVIYRCANYGTITSNTVSGGILGRDHDYDYHGRAFITVGECENFGTVKGTQYAGGIAGVLSPILYAAELNDCVNLGAVSSSKGYAGNFAGLMSVGASIDGAKVLHSVVNGGYAAGVVSAPTGKSGAIAGLTSGNYKVSVGQYTDTVLKITAPTYTNVSYFGELLVPTGVTKAENLDQFLEDLGTRLDAEVVAADEADQNAKVVLATPVVRGMQLGAIKDNKLSIRLVAGLYAKDAYQSLGFEVTTINEKGVSKTTVYPVPTIMTAIKETVNGAKKTVQAERVAAKYLYTAELSDISATGRVTIQATPVAVSRDGSKTYVGSTKTLSVLDGKVTNETMALNGALLENFVLVYRAQNTLAEKTLATHLAGRIAELTGVDLPVLSEANPNNRAYAINIGKVGEAGKVPAGRNISTIGDGVSIVISGDNTAQLGESVAYFIDLLAEKVANGDNSLYITTPIQAPAKTDVSIMSFNLGATDDTNLKAGEWELLVEYLPDVWTAQEPWAGFLDDFCNDFAVRPNTKFQVKAGTNDEVMATNVNNKAFTGNDYYGIYWGMPRWTPEGPNANQGRASYSVIFYAKDRFTVNEAKSGTFMFSETPNVIGSKISKSSMPRCATYLTLTDVNTGKEFVVVNVHLDHKNGQVEQATILVNELIKRVGKDTPMLITGDMNSKLDSAAIQHMMTNPTMPLHSFDYLATEIYWSDKAQFGIIDWIFTNVPEKVDVSYYRFCNDYNMFYNRWTNGKLQMYMPSDHPAIYCEFSFRG